MTLSEVLTIITNYTGVTHQEITSAGGYGSATHRAAEARRLYFYFAKRETTATYHEITALLNMTKSAITHSMRMHRTKSGKIGKYSDKIEDLKKIFDNYKSLV